MPHPIALVREPTASFVQALSGHPQKHSIDFDLALAQHRRYVEALSESGAEVIRLPALDDCPDAVFVEDTAVVTADVACLCRPIEESRRGEGESVRRALASLRPVHLPGEGIFIDGGDALQAGERIFVGLSRRTGQKAADWLASRLGREVVTVPVTACLHLKTAVTYLGRDILIADPARIDLSRFQEFEILSLAAQDGYAANCLAVGDRVILPAGFPRVERALSGHGFTPVPVDMSEFEKADGGVTCLSLLVP